jgi:SHS2 domain-containing protein
MKKYILFDHTADIGCEISGKSRKELFANGVAALFDLMLEQKSGQGNSPITQSIVVEGNDLEDLLINFLREILYLFNGRRWVITGCHISEITGKHIVAQLSGEPYNPRKHRVKMEIKAITYHGLSIKRMKNGWVARVIFDV